MEQNKLIEEIRENQAVCKKLSDEINEKIAATKLMAETLQIVCRRVQDTPLPKTEMDDYMLVEAKIDMEQINKAFSEDE